MSQRDVVVVGASAGGVEALRTLLAGLPADLPAAVLAVLHLPDSSSSVLGAVLDRAGPLPVTTAVDGARLEHGRVLVAPPGRHLLVERPGGSGGAEGVRLSAGPRENGHRPSVDVLFRSAALAAGPRVVGVVLSGSLDDGAAGLAAVRARGGLALVQDPDDALFPSMPRAAVAAAEPDPGHVVPLADLAQLLVRLVGAPAPEPPTDPLDPLLEQEHAVARLHLGPTSTDERPGDPSGYSCPDCAGVLWRVPDERVLRFRCRVGHAWSAGSLRAKQDADVDAALWTALRVLEERAALRREMAARAEAAGSPLSAQRFSARADETDAAARTIERLLGEPPHPAPDDVPEG